MWSTQQKDNKGCLDGKESFCDRKSYFSIMLYTAYIISRINVFVTLRNENLLLPKKTLKKLSVRAMIRLYISVFHFIDRLKGVELYGYQ